MNKTSLILRYEIITLLSKPSFLFGMFGIPLVAALVFGIAGRINQNEQAQSVFSQIIGSQQTIQAEGYVDQAQLIQTIPESVPAGLLVSYPDEASARQALEQGEISAFYLISENYLDNGEIIYIRPDFNPISASGQSGLFEWLVQVNLLQGDAQLATLVNGPLNLEEVSRSPVEVRDDSHPLTFFLPYLVTIIFYVVILGSASLLLSSVTKEKENRILEILMVSATPRQLLTGKIIGLGILGLVQTAVWVGTGRSLLGAGGSIFRLHASFQLPVSFLVWGLVFFLLGYAVYASLMAGLGALVPNMREASQVTIVVIMPLIIPMFLISALIEEPNGMLSLVLSMFPLTAPVAMMTRLAAATVPWWQPALAAALLLVTAVFVVRAVANMFRAQTMLSGQAFSLKLFLKALIGRA